MSDTISNIAGSAASVKLGTLAQFRRSSQRKGEGAPSSPAPLKDRIDRSAAAAPVEKYPSVTAEEMNSYVARLKQMADIVDPAKVQKAKDSLAQGAYGQEALSATAKAIGQDLGVLSI